MNLVERGTEHSIMKSMLDSCASGHGGVLLVSGAVASGKTALLRSFGERATAAGALYLQATASQAESDQPFGVMGQLLLGAGLLGAETRRAARLIGVSGDAHTWSEPAGAGAPAADALHVISGLCGIVLEKARERVVVLGIDDVHHTDERSLECLLYLARRLDFGRILVVLAENSSFPSANTRLHVDLLRLSGCRNIRLAPLQRQGVAEMIHETGEPGWRTRKLVSQLHRAGGGSPLLTRALIEDHRSSAATGTACADLVPGEAFARAVVTALYRSDSATRQIAGALAVAGPDVSLAELVEVLGSTRESTHRGLRALNEAGLLDAGWFRHEAGRAAVLRTMDPADRTRLEVRLAQVLHEHGAAVSVVVRHLIAAQKVDAPWALPVLIEAAGRALADDEVGLALTCLRVARDSRTDARQSLEIRAALTRAGWRVNPAGVAQHLPELTEAALDGRLGPRHADELAGHLLWFGQVERALEVLRTAERHGTEPFTRPGATVAPYEHDGPRRWMTYAYPGLAASTRSRSADAPRRETPQDVTRAAPRGETPEHAAAGHGTAEHPALRHARSRARGPHQRAATLTKALLAGAVGEVVVRAEQILQSTRLGDRTLTALLVALDRPGPRRPPRPRRPLVRHPRPGGRRTPRPHVAGAAHLGQGPRRAAHGRRRRGRGVGALALALVPADGWGVAVASPLATSVSAMTVLGRRGGHRLDQTVARALKDGSETYGAYFRVRHRDGALRWTHTHGCIRRDGTGRPHRIVGVVRDATRELGDSPPALRERADEEAERRRRTSLVQNTTAALAHARTVSDVIDVLKDTHGLAHLGAANLVMGLVEAGRIRLVAEGPAGSFVPGTRLTRVDEQYPMSEVVRTLAPRYIESARDFAASYPVLWPHIAGLGITAAAYLPLIAQARPIGVLGLLYQDKTGFTVEERNVLVALGSSIAQSLQRAMFYEQEKDLAQGLQQAMLPRTIPGVPGAEIAVRYRSAALGRDIGGDWYDVIPLPGGTPSGAGRVGAVIGDVQGHDTHAAAVMGQLRIVLRAYAAEGHTPATVMARASGFLHELDTDRFATCLYAEADLATGVVQFVRAGHLDPLLRLTDGTCRRVPVAGGLPLGLSAEFGRLDYPVTTLELDPGQTLLLCTDGLVEEPGHDLDDGMRALAELAASGPRDLRRLADRLCGIVDGRGGDDDAALLLLRRSTPDVPQAGGRLQQHVAPGDPEALTEARHMIKAAVRAWGAGSGPTRSSWSPTR
ncbi:hypothetical protein SALBM135S_05813 [Streptomyces alboniger]